MAKRAVTHSPKLQPEQVADIENAVFDIVEAQLPKEFYLLAVEFVRETGQWFLRIYVEGIDFRVALSHCEQVSRLLDPHIETLRQLENISYSLEVSSPGVFRPLKTAREFAFYQGTPIKLESESTSLPISEGTLKQYEPETQTLTILNKSNNEPVTVPMSEEIIVLLNPEIKFPE